MSIRSLLGTALTLAAAVMLIHPTAASAATGDVTLFRLPSSTNPRNITTGRDGNLWFTELDVPRVGRITPDGQITEFAVPSPTNGVAAGGDGNLWFTEPHAGKLARVTPSGAVTEFGNAVAPWAIAAGPDGNLWFTHIGPALVGRITSAGVITEFGPLRGNDPLGFNTITGGPDGSVWFTEDSVHVVGRVTPSGLITEFPLPPVQPAGIAAGPDGNVWFAELTGDKIARITPAGAITEFALPPNTFPLGITAGSDGNLWFTGSFGVIGRITTAGEVTLFPVNRFGFSCPLGITSGPDGNIWFVEPCNGAIGRVSVSGSRPPVISVPVSVEADATGPDGAIVSYSVTASDPDDDLASLVCLPSSGSLFSIGHTVVQCVATDRTGNTATSSFTVHVRGAPEQLRNLLAGVTAAGLGPGRSLEDQLSAALASLEGEDTMSACEALQSFINHVTAQSGKPQAAAEELIAGAIRVRTVLVCT